MSETTLHPEDSNRPGISRRRLLQLGLVGGVGLMASGGAVWLGYRDPSPPKAQPGPTSAESKAPEKERYPKHTVTATVFWVGEEASVDNAGIPNTSTEWDEDAGKRFGGVDDPKKRNAAGLPAGFTPKHNNFYFALPASEFTENGLIPDARDRSPWANEQVGEDKSLFRGRWAKITNPQTDESVYAQWLDTGPSDDPSAARDYDYVFGDGSVSPKNTFGQRAGIDVSPSAAAALGFLNDGSATVVWKFADPTDVPDGPWKQFPAIDQQTHWN